MKYTLLDILQCPCCSMFPLHLSVRHNRDIAGETGKEDNIGGCSRHCARAGQAISQTAPPADDCPKCLKTEIRDAILYCEGCRRWFPVLDGIPVMLPDNLRNRREISILENWGSFLADDIMENAMQYSLARPDAATNLEACEIDKLHEMQLRDKESGLYDFLYPDDKFKTELETYDQLFQPPPGAVVLDLGCGTGRVTKYFLEKCSFLVGADLSFQSLLVLRNRLTERQKARVHLVQTEACHLPFRPEVFDYVVSLGMFCQLPGQEMRNSGLKNALGVLRKNGIIIVSVYNFSLLKRLLGPLGLSQIGRKEGHKKDGIYFYNHTPTELREWLEPYVNVTDLKGTDNRVPVLQKLSARLNAKMDRLISDTPLALPVFSSEMTIKGSKK